MPPPPISIVGAGLSGSCLGQVLRRKNIPAVIYERVKAHPRRNNYGITLYNSQYKPLLDTLQINDEDFRHQVGVHHPDSGAAVSDGHKLRVNRAALTNLLQEGLDVRWIHRLDNITSGTSLRCATFQTNSHYQACTEEFSLLIGADGVHSVTRAQLDLPKSAFDLQVLPYIVFNGKRRITYSQLPAGLLDCFATPDGIKHTQDGTVLSIKADFWDAEQQTVAVSYTLSRAASKEGDQLLLDRTLSDAETLAERFVDEVAALGQLPAPFNGVFNPATMQEDRLLHWLMRTSLVDETAVKDVASGRGVVLLGDAAHAQPIPGNGANLAIGDALELAEHITAAGELDVSAFLKARAQHWADGKRENEQTLEELHLPGRRDSEQTLDELLHIDSSQSKARI